MSSSNILSYINEKTKGPCNLTKVTYLGCGRDKYLDPWTSFWLFSLLPSSSNKIFHKHALL